MKKVRMGIVGGGFGSSFQWHLDPDCVVEAVSDLNPARCEHLQKTYGCGKPYPSLEELIKDPNVDAVAVCTGAPDHVRHAVACMKAGKHVISAVPAATSLEEAALLYDTVKQTGLTYMMAETSHYMQATISARKFWREGAFGDIFYTEAEYHHAGMEPLFVIDGVRTWRYGYPPMLYPTHCTALLVGVTGERLVEVTCIGWGGDSPFLKDNAYNNPFGCQAALFKTDKGHAFRVGIFWYGAHRGCERAEWYGEKMSFFMRHPNGMGPVTVRTGTLTEKDSGGFVRAAADLEPYEQPDWGQTDMLPEPMRIASGHGGSHTFLTHEFVSALVEERKPAVDIVTALAYTVPGIVAHQSALKGGEQMKIANFG